jgi:hypothetical protein
MTWQQDQGDMLRVRTSKTRALIDLPCHPVLRAHLDLVRRQAKVVSLTGPIVLSERGKPYSVNAMSGQLRRQVERHPRVPNNRSFMGCAMPPRRGWKKAGRRWRRSPKCWASGRSAWR